MSITKRLIPFGITSVLLVFASVPIMFLLYGGAGGAIGGLMLLAPFMAVQYLILLVARRLLRRRRLRPWDPSETPGHRGSGPS